MPGTVASLLNAANAEWIEWERSTWDLRGGLPGTAHIGLTDDDHERGRYIIDNYCSVGGGSPSVSQIADDEYYWSAVGMSAIFKRAGFQRDEFPFAEAHRRWIKKFVRARRENRPALYHGYRLQDASPEVGDLIGYTYENVSIDQAQTYYDKTGSYKSHTDVVVARRAGEIDVIGANVLDSVTKKTLPLTDAGRLIPDDKHKWFVILKRHGF